MNFFLLFHFHTETCFSGQPKSIFLSMVINIVSLTKWRTTREISVWAWLKLNWLSRKAHLRYRQHHSMGGSQVTWGGESSSLNISIHGSLLSEYRQCGRLPPASAAMTSSLEGTHPQKMTKSFLSQAGFITTTRKLVNTPSLGCSLDSRRHYLLMLPGKAGSLLQVLSLNNERIKNGFS